jgi:hypothetical protein
LLLTDKTTVNNLPSTALTTHYQSLLPSPPAVVTIYPTQQWMHLKVAAQPGLEPVRPGLNINIRLASQCKRCAARAGHPALQTNGLQPFKRLTHTRANRLGHRLHVIATKPIWVFSKA